jgi:hypothetical protein
MQPAGLKSPAAAAGIEHDKDNDANNWPAHFHLDERIHLDERTARALHKANEAGYSLPVL